jgi:hypothetical protein
MQPGRRMLPGFDYFRESRCGWTLLLALAFLLIVFTGAGCQLRGKSETDGHATVEIRGNTPGQIGAATLQVFRDNGYSLARMETSTMTFEKKGSKMDAFAYGGWLDTVWVRVEVSIEPVAEQTFRLQTRVRLLQGLGALEEEVKHPKIKSAPYQQLLNEVAKRLGQEGQYDGQPPLSSEGG